MCIRFCSVLIIGHLDKQSKFEMFTASSGRHVCVPRGYTIMAATHGGLKTKENFKLFAPEVVAAA